MCTLLRHRVRPCLCPAAAHNCTMKAVAILGTHKAFNLKNADLTCANMRELTVYNLRWARRPRSP